MNKPRIYLVYENPNWDEIEAAYEAIEDRKEMISDLQDEIVALYDDIDLLKQRR